MPVDSVTWTALAFVLTAAGACWTYVSWQRRGLPAAVRALAWTLLPVAAWLTGTLRLAGQIVDAVGHWASRLVFNPFTWVGIILAGVSVVLFGTSRVLDRRGIGAKQKGSRRRRLPEAGAAPPAVRSGTEPAVLDDDVAAILKKHGIS